MMATNEESNAAAISFMEGDATTAPLALEFPPVPDMDMAGLL